MPKRDGVTYDAWAKTQRRAAERRSKVQYKKRRGPKGPAPFPVGAQVRYGETGVPHQVIKARPGESDARAPSGYVSTIVRKTAHLWQEVSPA
jgi:hypothetical protein